MTWTGTYTNELVATTLYQAQNGVRGVIDLDALGDVVVLTPPTAVYGEDCSFSLWFTNPTRNTLTIRRNPGEDDTIQMVPGGDIDPNGVITRLKHGVIGFTCAQGAWRLSDLAIFAVPVGVNFGAIWTPRTTNGLCAIIDQVGVTGVERTAEGRYTLTTDDPEITMSTLLFFQPNAVGLPVDNSAEITALSRTTSTIDFETGIRSKVGNWTDSDLTQNASNTVMLLGAGFP